MIAFAGLFQAKLGLNSKVDDQLRLGLSFFFFFEWSPGGRDSPPEFSFDFLGSKAG
jgi:hypothetical protein